MDYYCVSAVSLKETPQRAILFSLFQIVPLVKAFEFYGRVFRVREEGKGPLYILNNNRCNSCADSDTKKMELFHRSRVICI